LELEQYELAIEEQAYPFEEQAIAVHENNFKLIGLGIYNGWVDRSLQRLATFVPARYAKPEEASDIMLSLDTYTFAIDRPAAAVPEALAAAGETIPAEPAPTGAPAQLQEPVPLASGEVARVGQKDEYPEEGAQGAAKKNEL
jgi:hypothetical protein